MCQKEQFSRLLILMLITQMLVKAASWEHNDQIPCICTLMMMSDSFDHNQHSWLNWLLSLVTSLPQLKTVQKLNKMDAIKKSTVCLLFLYIQNVICLCVLFHKEETKLCIKGLFDFSHHRKCTVIQPPAAPLPSSEQRCFMKSFESDIKGPTFEMMVFCLSQPWNTGVQSIRNQIDKLNIR